MRLLAIVGPTASGKTELALNLAEQLKGEIISADSRQVYRYLDIGTSKPTKDDIKRIPHHFVDLLDPSEDYSAGAFGVQARKKVSEISGRNRQPLLVGGSGLYIKAVIDGLFEGPGKDPELRSQLYAQLETMGAKALLEKLQAVDPSSAARMDISKPRRIIRALEVYYTTGIPLSSFHKQQSSISPFTTVQFAIAWSRSQLYDRINKRVESMLSVGFVDEVRRLRDRGYNRSLNALNTVGYKEAFDHIDGRISYEDMTERIKRNTRRFAKRQMTWFNGDKRVIWLKPDETLPFTQFADAVIREFKQH